MRGVTLISLGAVGTVQAFIIGTTPGEFTQISSLGETIFSGQTTIGSLGQTFIAPTTDNILNEFTFFLVDELNTPFESDVTDFRAFVAAFNSTTNTITGDILFESTPKLTIFIDSQIEQPFTFSTGGLTLISGQEYVALLSPVKDLDGISGFANLTYSDESIAPGVISPLPTY